MIKLAHPGKRFQGQFIDGLIVVLLFGICITIKIISQAEGTTIDLAIIAIPSAYYLFCDALPNGQSIAKRCLNIAVVHRDTLQDCNLWQSFIRNAITPILGLLDAMLILTQERRRVGDYLAKTIVVERDY
ncbi:MAG: putative RDD family membrane protein YckC [Candidatus Endobugula sp.]|jgi:uncharacterized RDD family membrane protein YckC